MSLQKKIYTCTPVDFPGDEGFFSRDSGLLCSGLKEIGIESMAIMPGLRRDSDQASLLRTDYKNLEDADWWLSLEIDGVVLYSWGSPKYNSVALALKHAGIPFIVNMDTSGLISRHASPENWKQEIPIFPNSRLFLKKENLIYILKNLRDTFFHVTAKKRMLHFDAATWIGATTPTARLWIGNEMCAVGRKNMLAKLIYLPHPQLSVFDYNAQSKKNLVVTVARWEEKDRHQKMPEILVPAYVHFLKANPNWSGLIIGKGATKLAEEFSMDLLLLTNRLKFREFVPSPELKNIYQSAKIGFWSSRSEGQQGTGAQALCCGCSVVSNSLARMNCFRHYTSRESGRLAERNTPQALAEALQLEADAWAEGQRDPERISKIWTAEFHANSVAKKASELLCNQKQSSKKI